MKLTIITKIRETAHVPPAHAQRVYFYKRTKFSVGVLGPHYDLAVEGRHSVLWYISFRCGALFNSSSIRNSDFLIFAFCVLILIPP